MRGEIYRTTKSYQPVILVSYLPVEVEEAVTSLIPSQAQLGMAPGKEAPSTELMLEFKASTRLSRAATAALRAVISGVTVHVL